MSKIKSTSKYQELKPNLIVATLSRLEKRIKERFPKAGLGQVASELLVLANEIQFSLNRIKKPNWWIRGSAFIAVGAIFYLIFLVIKFSISLRMEVGLEAIGEGIQTLEALINEIIFLALAFYFFFTLDTRLKRRKALKELYRIRSIVHVIDMHQLTKDPAYILVDISPTASSPQRTMTAFELTRYLNYCTELLSLTSKLAALYAQNLNDAVVLNAVTDIESLAGDMSGKIMQKITILDLAIPESEEE